MAGSVMGLWVTNKYAIFVQGRHQFYSYIPRESPTTRFFPVRGMRLDVRFSNPVNNLSLGRAPLKHCKNCKTAPTGQRKVWLKERLLTL